MKSLAIRHYYEGFFILILVVIVVLLLSGGLRVDVTNDEGWEPLNRAQKIWGYSARIGRVKQAGVNNDQWLYQVGCYFPGHNPPFIIAGEGKSWEEAFQSVDRKFNGPVVVEGQKSSFVCNEKSGKTTVEKGHGL